MIKTVQFPALRLISSQKLSMYQLLKPEKKDVLYIARVSLVYCALSASFSLVSTVVPDRMVLTNPLEHGSLSLKEVAGHFAWGAVAALVTLRLRYILLGGLLAVLIDSDHLIGLLHVEGIPRMSHSIAFAIISTIVLVAIFRKNNYRLGAIVATSILTHISYDIFDGEFGFPVLTPVINTIIQFPKAYWIVFEVAAIAIVGIVSLVSTKKEPDKQALQPSDPP